jgi:ABC-type transporter Mla subunit MlaD
LRQALAAEVSGRERAWAAAVGDALARVEAALRQLRAAAKDLDGLFAEVDDTWQTLARQADELRSDHDDLLASVVALQKEVRRAAEALPPAANRPAPPGVAGAVDFGTLRRRAEQLLAGLQENKEAETRLVLESVNTDIGAGD